MNPQRNRLWAKLRTLCTALTLLGALVGCQPKAVRPPTPSATPAQTADTAGAVRYVVDSAASELHILVYRGGSMARLGHNHVVSSKQVAGTLLLHSDLARSQLELTLPVASLQVDDPKARAAEGEDFSAEVPQEAREGTKRNLNRPELLDGENFPTIKLQTIAVSGTREAPTMMMRVTIKDASHDVVVLAEVQANGGTVLAQGEFAIQQTDFGIKPFSVALGALQVQDKLRIRFSIVCRQQQ